MVMWLWTILKSLMDNFNCLLTEFFCLVSELVCLNDEMLVITLNGVTMILELGGGRIDIFG